MNEGHISFIELCDFCDNILTEVERESIENHLKVCSQCNKEFNNLYKVLGMLSNLKLFGIKSEEEFVFNTLKKIKRRKGVLLKLAPSLAIAASIFIIMGVVLFSNGFFKDKGYNDFNRPVEISHEGLSAGWDDSTKDNRYSQYMEIESELDVSRILLILRNNNVWPIRVHESNIECDVDLRNYKRLLKEFNYTSSYNINRNYNRKNILEVGFSEEESFFRQEFSSIPPSADDRVIRLVIYSR